MDGGKAAFRGVSYRIRVIPCLLACLVLSESASGRPDTQGLKIQRSQVTGLASFMTAADGGSIDIDNVAATAAVRPIDFLRAYGDLFGVEDPVEQLVAESTIRDSLGQAHTTYRQVHKGIPVFSGVLKVHQDSDGRVIAANGDFYPIDAKLDLTPPNDCATATAVAAAGVEAPISTVERCELVLVDPGWYGDSPLGVRLAYYIILTDPSAGVHEAFFVDAHSREVLDQWTLRHTSRERRVYDGLGTYELPGELVRREGEEPVTEPEDANRAYDYFGDTYDYFHRAFGRDSLDDEGLPLLATVDSTAVGCPNAAWITRGGYSVFCPGTVMDDIVAHELTHGITHFTAGLVYQNQPGQLNESFSDVFGELVDLFNGDVTTVGPPSPEAPWPSHPTGGGLDSPNLRRRWCSPAPEYPGGVRWLMGEEATGFGGAIRDMWDPTCFGMPDRAYSELQICQTWDNGGVHTGSSIVNHAFAMLVDGDSFNGYTIRAIGAIKAAEVWYRALTVYMTVAFNFEDAYVAFNQAALDLIGTFPNDPRTGLPAGDMFTASDAEEVDHALRAVELNGYGRCGWVRSILDPDPPPPCTARTPVFADDFENGNAGWTVFNTGPPTRYDWVLTTARLPYGRPGTAWFCEDSHAGDCAAEDESAVHSLMSPPITLPADADYPMLAFAHHLATEEGYDGGNISISVNDSLWRLIPGSAFKFNPYNSIIKPEAYGNSNPLGGREGWTGAGGKWGISVADLGSFASGGDTIRIRFDFGKDECIGSDGWYLDDFEVYTCPDCNRNGIPDSGDFVFTIASPPLGPVGKALPQQFIIPSPPKASGRVAIYVSAIADLGSHYEELAVTLNGLEVGTVFTNTGRDCPLTPDTHLVSITADVFNSAVAGGDAVIDLTATSEVDPNLCKGGTFVKLFAEIPAVVADEDQSGIPDECENCAAADAPLAEPGRAAKNRYISLIPGNGGRQTALRVRFTDLPCPFEKLCGGTMWVEEPHKVRHPFGGERPGWYAHLSCEPVFLDWSAFDVVHVSDREIVPDGIFTVQAIDLACYQPGLWEPTVAAADLRFLSDPLDIPTVESWGHVNGASDGMPFANRVTALDVAAIVDTVKLLPEALSLDKADLHPDIPDQKVSVLEVAVVVDALLGAPYPYEGPRVCP